MGKIFKELEKEHGRAVEGFTIEEVVRFDDNNRRINLENAAVYINRLEYRSWAVDEEGDSLIVTVYRESFDDYIMAECEADNWDTAAEYKLSGGWEPVHGLTSQYGYRGAILHDCESIGAGMVKHMLESEGVFTWAPVAYEAEGGNVVLEGWCLLEKEM